MIIERGLFDGIVLQRIRNVSDADISGCTVNDGLVIARVTNSSGRAVSGFSAKQVGKAYKGCFTACLKGIPVGGPYDVLLFIGEEKLEVKNVFVGDVWILGGQSNMEGSALAEPAIESNDMVRAFYSDDKWGIAIDPIHTLYKAVDPIHAILGAAENKYRVRGPGISFGLAMQDATGVPQGLIACAHGGTSMSQWSPALKRLKGNSLYGATLRRVEKNGGKISGILWYQGCSDADKDNAPKYTLRMKKLIEAFRKDLKNAKLPFLLVQIARVFRLDGPNADAVFWNSIQEQQRQLPEKVKNCLTVPAIDLPLDDCIHLSGVGQIALGRRLADAMLAFTGMVRGHMKPIEFAGFRLIKDKFGRGCNIGLSFKNVAGELKALGASSGFGLSKLNGEEINGIYKIETNGTSILLYTQISLEILDIHQLQVHYALGFAPYCNITDSAGRSLPVFGPIRLMKPKAVTPFVLEYAISKLVPFSGNPAAMHCPDINDDSMGWKKHRFDSVWFAERHQELKNAPNCVCYYLTEILCGEDTSGELLMGYDGPVKVWLDDKVVMQDIFGTNPAIPDRSKAKLFLKKDKKYRIAIALNSNNGKAWGISLRFVKNGVSRAKLYKGPHYYNVPIFMLPDIG